MPKRKVIVCSNGMEYANVREANKDIRGYSTRPITRCLKGQIPSAYGLRWKYEKR